MTVGEKIQYYRKKIGISQEELGQKLFVSRQTISLWEMDKTLPTLDNLMRLKEIFSVSIDDILSEAEPTETKHDMKESYQFQYSEVDLRNVFKMSIQPIVKKFIIFVVVYIALFVVFAISNAPDAVIGLGVGIFIAVIISYIKTFITSKKMWTATEKRIAQSVYQYDVYDKFFVVNISQNGEVTKTFKIYFDEIEKINDLGKYLIVQYNGQTYLIDKNALCEDSHFYTFCNKNPEKIEAKNNKEPSRVISTLLFVLSIVSIFGAMFCVAILSSANRMFVENMWVFFLFTPIPVASIVVGICLNRKGKKHKKNIIVGIVMTVLLCIYGSFTFVFSNIYTHDEEPILRIEQTLSIDIPQHTHINTQDWTKGTQTVKRGYIFSTSDIYFEENAVKEFEENLPLDSKWISVISNDMIGITSVFFDEQLYDYFIIYNTQTKEFNQLPSESGTYRFINVLYNTNSNTMKIVEYEIEYIK